VEHEHEAAAPAPAAPVVAAPAAVGAGPPLATALTPARVLALQRTIGNRATGAILARVPAAGAGDFGVSGGVPVSSGNVTVAKNGDKVKIKSPTVTMDGSAWLKKDRELGSTAYIGIVQNLVSSTRGAVYRHGGDPAGEITATHLTGNANKWDSVSDANDDTKPQTFAPFYWKPGTIDDQNNDTNPAKATHLGTPSDTPEFNMPVNDGPGRITTFKGADNFKMGMAIKKESAIWMLTGTSWSVDWNVPVDKDLSGAGKAVETKAIQDLLKDGPDVSLTEWSLDPKAASPFEAFSTQADAMKRTPAQLLGWLFAARQHDPVSYKNICLALDAKAPDLSVAINCDTTDATFGKDTLSASVKRNGALIKTEAGISLNNGESHTVKVGWAEAIGSAAGLTPGTAITVELYVAELDVKIVTVPFPFKSGGEVAPGTGKYKVSLSV
jgi:hypothetical protein